MLLVIVGLVFVLFFILRGVFGEWLFEYGVKFIFFVLGIIIVIIFVIFLFVVCELIFIM